MADFPVAAVALDQNGQELYAFSMNSVRLRKLCYVTPRTKERPEEIQRIVDDKRAKAIGEYISKPNALLPNAIVVSLDPEVKIDKGSGKERTIHFPSPEKKVAYVLDGQHRLEGFKYSGAHQFDLPVIALYGAPEGLRAKVFADINSKQKPVSQTHLQSLRHQIGDLSKDDSEVMAVIVRLNSDNDSVLAGKIKMIDGETGTWITNSALKRVLAPHINGKEAALLEMTTNQQAGILKGYFRAISELWPDAWGDADHNLCATLGFELMLGVFAVAKHRCDLRRGFKYSAADFVAMLKPLREAKLRIVEGGDISLDWERGGDMRVLGNAATRMVATREMTRVLRAADAKKKAAGGAA